MTNGKGPPAGDGQALEFSESNDRISNGQSPATQHRKQDLPLIPVDLLLQTEIDAFIEGCARKTFDADQVCDREAMRLAVDRAPATIAASQALLQRLRVLNRPASRAEIAQHLLILVGAFPNTARADLKLFSRVLAEDVASAQPSAIVLERACRRIRRTATFVPTIAEVLAAIEMEEKSVKGSIFWLANHPEQIERIKRRHGIGVQHDG
jgi:hypothetical protein